MISFESAARKESQKLDASYVVWLGDRLARDARLAETFQQGAEVYPYSFIAFFFGTNAADMEPHNLLGTFKRSHLGNFPTEEQALQAVLGRVGWQHEVTKIGDPNDEEPVTDFLSWKTEMLRERFAEQFAFVPIPGALAAFDLDPIEEAIREE